MKILLAALSVIAFAGPAIGATAPPGDDVAALRAELAALKADYQQRLGAIEARIATLETVAQAAPAEATPAPVVAAAAGGGGATAFNPTVSVILAGNYAHTSADPSSYRIAGFMPPGGDVGPGNRGFNLGESELTLAANVDSYFYANLTASLTADDQVSVEEAYFRSIGLPAGLTLKGGRFLSGLGYLNEVHAHAWDFTDQPLVYQALFGSQLHQDGLQLKWLAPTDLFVELGAELGNADSFPATRASGNGWGTRLLFAHAGGDIGDSTSWRAGASWLDADAIDRSYVDVNALAEPVVNAFTGSSRTLGADFTLKWAPHGDSTRRQLKLQGEYFRRRERGTLVHDLGGSPLSGAYVAQPAGWYLQGVYLFRPRWRLGLRYDQLNSGRSDIDLLSSGALTSADLPGFAAARPSRGTVMLDWSPSEFSRLRAQFALDAARAGVRDRELQLQYLYAIGAHGAHKY